MNQADLLLVESTPLCRDGLRLILLGADYRVSETASANDYLSRMNAEMPDLVLWGPGMGEKAFLPDIAAVRSRASTGKPVRLVVLTGETGGPALRRLAALDLDAILFSDVSSEVLRRSLDLVILGQRLYPPPRPTAARALSTGPIDVLHRAVSTSNRSLQPTREIDEVVLSWREGQILMHLRDGASNKAIARNLQITEATVKVHVKSVLRKLRATNRTQAAMWALSNRYRVLNAVTSSHKTAPAA